MRILLKVAFVYVLAILPFAWFLHSDYRLAAPDALIRALTAPYDAVIQLMQGSLASLVPLGAFLFILFIGLTVVWATESERTT
jgi:hypothetical protein